MNEFACNVSAEREPGGPLGSGRPVNARWGCTVAGMEEDPGEVIFEARTRSAARYKCFKAANDAGFDVQFRDINVRRIK